MNRTELAELIRNGENSGVEFKRDDIRPEQLAKEIAALLNLEGGHILLGVEDDLTVSGLTRDAKKAEEWVLEIARVHVRPATMPVWEPFAWGDGKIIGIVSLPADSPDKPYKAKRGSAWVTQVRAGSTTRDASDEEEMRLYMQSGRIQYDRKAMPGSSFEDFDLRRLVNYFRDIRQQEHPAEDDSESWITLLVNTELMVWDRGYALGTVGGLLLFGKNPNRHLKQAGITATAYSGTEKDYDAKARAILRGPVVSLFPLPNADFPRPYPSLPETFSKSGAEVESGVVEQALEFVKRAIDIEAWLEGARRVERWDYPLSAIREAVVNAVVHRDYTIIGTDIELSIYADRIEVVSPGRLPNSVTVEKMRDGCRAARNELLKETMRDYRYIEANGLGVPRRIIRGMQEHNGTDPDLIEEESRFTVRLWKEPRPYP